MTIYVIKKCYFWAGDTLGELKLHRLQWHRSTHKPWKCLCRYINRQKIWTKISRTSYMKNNLSQSHQKRIAQNQIFWWDDNLKVCWPNNDNLFCLLNFKKKPIRGDCIHMQKRWRYFSATYVNAYGDYVTWYSETY